MRHNRRQRVGSVVTAFWSETRLGAPGGGRSRVLGPDAGIGALHGHCGQTGHSQKLGAAPTRGWELPVIAHTLAAIWHTGDTMSQASKLLNAAPHWFITDTLESLAAHKLRATLFNGLSLRLPTADRRPRDCTNRTVLNNSVWRSGTPVPFGGPRSGRTNCLVPEFAS